MSKFIPPQPTYELPPITGRIGSSQVPCSDYVTIFLLDRTKPAKEKGMAIFDSDGSFDCWRSSEHEIYWADEVRGWTA